MRHHFLQILLVCTLFFPHFSFAADEHSVSDKDVVDAYHYFIGRLLVLRQELLDFQDPKFQWNKIVHRGVGDVRWANPNLDVAYSEAWMAIDDKTCTMVEMPVIKGRYYTFQVLNSWGETVSNINERTFPKHPSGKFAYCTDQSKVKLPSGTEKISLIGHKFRVLARVGIGGNMQEAASLQHQIKIYSTGKPVIAKAVSIPIFSNKNLIGVQAFDNADKILDSEPDTNPGMEVLQSKVHTVAEAVNHTGQREEIDKVIQQQAIPSFMKDLVEIGQVTNSWSRPTVIGSYGSDYLARSLVNYGGIWANVPDEAVYYRALSDSKGLPLKGADTYSMTFAKDELPGGKAHYFWSVVAVDNEKFQVIPNPSKKYIINNHSDLKRNADGSLTLVFAPKLPERVNKANWLPTPNVQGYSLTLRYYGPAEALKDGSYFPPPLVRFGDDHLAKAMSSLK
jgi:hypothetical protein